MTSVDHKTQRRRLRQTATNLRCVYSSLELYNDSKDKETELALRSSLQQLTYTQLHPIPSVPCAVEDTGFGNGGVPF